MFSSFTGLPDSYFEGYCFHGASYIYGNGGRIQFSAETDNEVGPGLDGCYLTILSRGESRLIGSDSSGFNRIYYYSVGDVWCFSNSLFAMSKHLRANGVRLSVNYPQLASLTLDTTLTTQASTFQTVFNEISLLPSDAYLIFDTGRLTPQAFCMGSEDASYEDGLRNFLGIWRDRFATLFMDSSVSVSSDLTGGVDSRAVFALLVSGATAAGVPVSDSVITSNVSDYWAADWKVAEAIVGDFGMKLERKAPAALSHSTDTSYRAWIDLCLGSYLPVYFPAYRSTPENIHFQGGGGENFRPFYKTGDASLLAKNAIKHDPDNPLLRDWANSFVTTARALRGGSQLSEMILHYREFRGRIHSGRSAQMGVRFAPLSSGHLSFLDRFPEKVDSGQLNFDIMESLVPGLVGWEYDDLRKAPTESNLSNITRINDLSELKTGGVYASLPPLEISPAKLDGRSRLGMLNSDYRAARTSTVVKFIGEKRVASADAYMDEALEKGGFRHMVDSKDVARVLTVHFAFTVAGVTS